MGQTPDRHPGPIEEDENILLEPQAVHPTTNGQFAYVEGQGFRFYEEGLERGLAGGALPPATAYGQVLLSVDAATFTVRQPLTQAGWLVSDLGIMLVTG